jgi:hypothetical protein
MPKAILHGCTIAITGTFGKDRDPVSLKRWIDSNGGKWAGTKVEPGVTHLICSSDAYKSHNSAVQKAEHLKIDLVTYDWLEDSLQNKHRYKAAGKYTAKNAFKMSRKEKAERKKRERKALKEDGTFTPFSFLADFHITDHSRVVLESDMSSHKKSAASTKAAAWQWLTCFPVRIGPNSATRDPESYGGIAADFFDRHLNSLEGKGKGKDDAPRKPDVEEYNLWDKVGKEQGGEAEKCADTGEAADEGEGDVEMFDGGATSSSHTSSSGANGTPSLESSSARDSASPTRTAPPCLKSTPIAMSAAELAGQPISLPSKLTHTRTTPPPNPKTEALCERLGYGSTPTFKNPLSLPQLPSIRPRLQYKPADPTPDIDNHHLYRDITGFVYDIKLLRLDLAKNTNERFMMRLYESNTTPHTYAVHVRFMSSLKKRVLSPSVKALSVLPDEGVVVAAVGSAWEGAFGEFRRVFKHLSGLEWEERLDGVKAGRMRTDMQELGGLFVEGQVEKYFKYTRPKEGEPRGLLPPGGNKG